MRGVRHSLVIWSGRMRGWPRPRPGGQQLTRVDRSRYVLYMLDVAVHVLLYIDDILFVRIDGSEDTGVVPAGRIQFLQRPSGATTSSVFR